MPGQERLRKAQDGLEFTDTERLYQEQVQDAKPVGLGKRFEDSVEGFHVILRLFAYAYILPKVTIGTITLRINAIAPPRTLRGRSPGRKCVGDMPQKTGTSPSLARHALDITDGRKRTVWSMLQIGK